VAAHLFGGSRRTELFTDRCGRAVAYLDSRGFSKELTNGGMAPRTLAIVNREADVAFHALARDLSLDPADPWLGRYVEYEWNHLRHVFESELCPVGGRVVLEFGCNIGATSIVLAKLGAAVKAVDVNPRCVALAEHNARRYGVEDNIDFHCLPDTRSLPFASESFDLVSCSSVLEYVPGPLLGAIQEEIARVTKKGGAILIAGTSNRLWPVEVHSRRWLINYLPRCLDKRLFGRPMQRGIWPWLVRRGFGPYEDLLLVKEEAFLQAKLRTGASQRQIRLLSFAGKCSKRAGISVGMLLPSMFMVLRKRGDAAQPERLHP
jgi:SAM-dependent methyltransferase